MGAWGTEPFQNDSALDWLHRIEREVTRAFKPALRALKKRKFRRRVWPKASMPEHARKAWLLRRKLKTEPVEHLSLVPGCQEQALAAVQLILAVPELQTTCLPPDYTVNLTQQAERVLLQLKADEGFISIWREPPKYVAVLDRELGRIRKVLRVQRKAHEEVVQRHVRRIKRMSKAERDKMVKGSRERMTWNPTFKEAFKIADGRELLDPPPLPRLKRVSAKANRARLKAQLKKAPPTAKRSRR